jgi:glycogen debranching enzyme
VMWSEQEQTWRDVGPDGSPTSSVQVVDALLPALVTPDGERATRALRQVTDPSAFGLPFGPAQVHPAETTYDAGQYWRGPAWPPLTYLLWRAAVERGLVTEAELLAAMLARGAAASGFAEYWNAATGAGLGAIPQSWACLAVVPDVGRPDVRRA